jgi:hypothetical protein
MSEFDLDDLLAGAVDDYRAETLHQIKPAGSVAAQATAAHRKRIHTTAMSVLALVLVAAPVAAYAATDHDRNGPPSVAPGNSSSPTVVPPSASIPPSVPPTTPSSPPSTTQSGITETQLGNATLQIPSWGLWDGVACPHGQITFSNGHFVVDGKVGSAPDEENGLIKMVSVDLFRDGGREAIGLFGCGPSIPGTTQVIAFDMQNGPNPHTIGQVLAPGGTIGEIGDIRANADGTVSVLVDERTGERSDPGQGVMAVSQWRIYGWTGQKFAQTAGPTSFITSAALSTHVTDLTFGAPASNGKRTGTMTVTMHNTESNPIAGAWISYYFPGLPPTSVTGMQVGSGGLGESGTGTITSIAAGATATVTFHFEYADSDLADLHAQPSLSKSGALLEIGVGDQAVDPPDLGRAVFR